MLELPHEFQKDLRRPAREYLEWLGRSPNPAKTALFEAIDKDDADGIELAIRAGASPDSTIETKDDLALCLPPCYSLLPPLKMDTSTYGRRDGMLDTDIESNPAWGRHARCLEGRHALYLAAVFGCAKACDALLKYGATVDATISSHRSCNGWTAIMVAAQQDHAIICEVLIQHGAGLNARGGNEDYTPLMIAAKFGHATTCKLLLERGAATELRNDWGRTALFFAAHAGHADLCAMLIDGWGAQVDAQAGNGWTPLIGAAWNGLSTVCRILVERGASLSAEGTIRDGAVDMVLAGPELRELRARFSGGGTMTPAEAARKGWLRMDDPGLAWLLEEETSRRWLRGSGRNWKRNSSRMAVPVKRAGQAGATGRDA
jgi:hypothetical protein